jgi:hypothetical protein
MAAAVLRATGSRITVPDRPAAPMASRTRNRWSSAPTQVTPGGAVGQRRHPLQGQRQQALAVDERDELLGKRFARQGPEPGAGAAAQDDGLDTGASSCPVRKPGHSGAVGGRMPGG